MNTGRPKITPAQVACETCGANPYFDCRQPGGAASGYYHRARVDLAKARTRYARKIKADRWWQR